MSNSRLLAIAAPLAAAALAAAAPALAQLDLPRPSPKATVSQTVGLTDVTITYCRPGVKGRVIWGGLVPYDQVWRTGANEATTITFADDVTIDGNKLRGRHVRPVHDPGQGRVDGHLQQGRQAVGRLRVQAGRRRPADQGQAA